MTLQAPFVFRDKKCVRWEVPKDAAVDGASIPRFLWTIIGGPWDGAYRNASVVHDWYCFKRSKPWQAVHRMFFDAMLASGVGAKKAKIMYLAVYYKGPRWDELTIRNSKLLSDAQKAVNASVLRSTSTAAKFLREGNLVKASAEIETALLKMKTNGDQFLVASVKRDVDLAKLDFKGASEALDAMITSGVPDVEILASLYIDRANLAYEIKDFDKAKKSAQAVFMLDENNTRAAALLSSIERQNPSIANQDDDPSNDAANVIEFQRLANIVETKDLTLEQIDQLVDGARSKR